MLSAGITDGSKRSHEDFVLKSVQGGLTAELARVQSVLVESTFPKQHSQSCFDFPILTTRCEPSCVPVFGTLEILEGITALAVRAEETRP
jgi:hypothetical protein